MYYFPVFPHTYEQDEHVRVLVEDSVLSAFNLPVLNLRFKK